MELDRFDFILIAAAMAVFAITAVFLLGPQYVAAPF
jgi:hypothetical protein